MWFLQKYKSKPNEEATAKGSITTLFAGLSIPLKWLDLVQKAETAQNNVNKRLSKMHVYDFYKKAEKYWQQLSSTHRNYILISTILIAQSAHPVYAIDIVLWCYNRGKDIFSISNFKRPGQKVVLKKGFLVVWQYWSQVCTFFVWPSPFIVL